MISLMQNIFKFAFYGFNISGYAGYPDRDFSTTADFIMYGTHDKFFAEYLSGTRVAGLPANRKISLSL